MPSTAEELAAETRSAVARSLALRSQWFCCASDGGIMQGSGVLMNRYNSG